MRFLFRTREIFIVRTCIECVRRVRAVPCISLCHNAFSIVFTRAAKSFIVGAHTRRNSLCLRAQDRGHYIAPRSWANASVTRARFVAERPPSYYPASSSSIPLLVPCTVACFRSRRNAFDSSAHTLTVNCSCLYILYILHLISDVHCHQTNGRSA